MRYLIIIGLALFVGAYWEHTSAPDYKQALAICNTAHVETSGQSEQACGDAQARTDTEYLCNQTGAYCWLEVK